MLVEKEFPPFDLSLVQFAYEGKVHKSSGKSAPYFVLGHFLEVGIPVKYGPVGARRSTHNPIRVIAVNGFKGHALMIWFGEVPWYTLRVVEPEVKHTDAL